MDTLVRIFEKKKTTKSILACFIEETRVVYLHSGSGLITCMCKLYVALDFVVDFHHYYVNCLSLIVTKVHNCFIYSWVILTEFEIAADGTLGITNLMFGLLDHTVLLVTNIHRRSKTFVHFLCEKHNIFVGVKL